MRRPGNLIFSERLGARAATDSLFSPLERAKERDRKREGREGKWAKRTKRRREDGMENDERVKRKKKMIRENKRGRESRGPCFVGPELCIVKREGEKEG